jgi:hypothetical protein
MLEKLDNFWREQFRDISPIAYELKRLCSDRWVRFHSLPESKRYAETPEEHRVILERYNAVIEGLNVSGSNLFLITSQWGDSDAPDKDRNELNILDPDALFWRSLPLHELTKSDDQIFLHLFVSLREWRKGIFDSILGLVADDKLASIMIVNILDKWVYYPYDGGADIILKSTLDRDNLKQKYFMWLSNHPLGY